MKLKCWIWCVVVLSWENLGLTIRHRYCQTACRISRTISILSYISLTHKPFLSSKLRVFHFPFPSFISSFHKQE
ncbi:hypothetical protein VNO77_39702 [Canavalia gladiata]|uniref:Secreted protein n=1 Tax=Canavalia gladiata TaxID=3824 RepID=A0AAN9JZ27_CANGL